MTSRWCSEERKEMKHHLHRHVREIRSSSRIIWTTASYLYQHFYIHKFWLLRSFIVSEVQIRGSFSLKCCFSWQFQSCWMANIMKEQRPWEELKQDTFEVCESPFFDSSLGKNAGLMSWWFILNSYLPVWYWKTWPAVNQDMLCVSISLNVCGFLSGWWMCFSAFPKMLSKMMYWLLIFSLSKNILM